jgi:hypothetical protein
MNWLLKPSAAVFSIFAGLAVLDSALPKKQIRETKEIKTAAPAPKIQAALLLDVSNSMDGLIEQAKAQLWNMVSVMGKAKCDEVSPQIEIALYEYGRDHNDPKLGYVKQISPFTTDLDGLSQQLFKLNTYGGSEYCGQVIFTSLNELKWDAAPTSYKVIFISGNEDFLQGTITYTQACEEARKKGVIVNTIYCGDRLQGIKEHWNLGSECGKGSFTNINSDAKPEDIPTPYDSTLMVLNTKLNGTYLYYGFDGKEKQNRQVAMDGYNYSINKKVAADRAVVKANSGLYDNSSWDMMDAYRADSNFIARVDMKTLPDSLKNKSRAELKKIVDNKNKERGAIQGEIITINKQRESYIATERAKAAVTNGKSATLESEVEKIIKEQAKRYNMIIQ